MQVATVGLNPSSTEFLDEQGVWRDRAQRLPVVMDFSVQQRNDLSDHDVDTALGAQGAYFSDGESGRRGDHGWFGAFKGLLKACGAGASYADGTAVHLDLVACPTWRAWSDVAPAAREAMIVNCRRRFEETVRALPAKALLFLDGATVQREVARAFSAKFNRTALASGLVVWEGVAGEHRCYGWRDPLWYQSNQQPLVEWLRDRDLRSLAR